MFHTSVPLHILLCFPPNPLGMSILLLIILQTISKCSVFPWFPMKSSFANSVLRVVEFLPHYSVVCLFIYMSIPRILLYVLAHSFISSLLVATLSNTIHCAVTTTVNRIDHGPGLTRLALKMCVELKWSHRAVWTSGSNFMHWQDSHFC